MGGVGSSLSSPPGVGGNLNIGGNQTSFGPGFSSGSNFFSGGAVFEPSTGVQRSRSGARNLANVRNVQSARRDRRDRHDAKVGQVAGDTPSGVARSRGSTVARQLNYAAHPDGTVSRTGGADLKPKTANVGGAKGAL